MTTVQQSGKYRTRGEYGDTVTTLHRVVWDAESNSWRKATPQEAEQEARPTWGAWDSDHGWLAPWVPE